MLGAIASLQPILIGAAPSQAAIVRLTLVLLSPRPEALGGQLSEAEIFALPAPG